MLGKFFQKPSPTESDSPPETLRERVPPGQYLTNGFPIMTYGQAPPHLSRKEWKLKVWGLVPNFYLG
jgi:DMSO/TMAO reductase YedYZ molybdopterin-dependent catalytic subunit